MRFISSCARTNSLFKLLRHVSSYQGTRDKGYGPLFILDILFLQLDIPRHLLVAVKQARTGYSL